MIKKEFSSDVYNAISLLLAEKRTSLAILRTAIAIFTLPISVFTVLIATSRYYDVMASLHFIIPLLTICILLIIFGAYLILRSFKRIKDVDHKIQEIKKQYNMKDIIDSC
ncbi:MAG: hypothetical protein AYK22_02275 [Thermoplasmatales archaeon SG8-52-3]|nr:MAG: hypothetical protein AYK22_02275 [Thermoplasmatales archaeon SG8-52-3]